ncbi:cytochrome oxidase putative small subunit CydP [Paludibacterium yongneupense]|uniref:cytochrome oxidase putative small subunit CydP n=1 Tax=Paludibacterium yongneupense TaxID=400061 RepID=UPI000409E43A|nr:cytochrome oxidase putative small subunit CydP [Paludibacterium yongneupense]
MRFHDRYRKEIVGVLVIKLVLIIVIKQVWFTDRPPVNGDTVAQQLLTSGAQTAEQRKSHD